MSERAAGQVVLVRHGETEWSRTHRHTGRTDVALTSRGEAQARALGRVVGGRDFAAVLSSPRTRALRTAELAGLRVTAVDEALAEWDYGAYEGMTAADIRRDDPQWTIWTHGAVSGESSEQMAVRADRALTRIRSELAGGDVAVVAHGHLLRALTARWLERPVVDGRMFRLDTATWSVLGTEHDRPVVIRWNVEAPQEA